VSERRIFMIGREGIRVREIHQMNCFDDAVCLLGMSLYSFRKTPGVEF